MSNEQAILEFAFHAMGRFAFDRVKEVCDKEKDSVKNPQGFALGWSQFVYSLSQLSQAEKTYFCLGFLLQTPNNPKAFRKKEVPLQAQYGQIKQDLDKQMDHLQRLPLSESGVGGGATPRETASGKAGVVVTHSSIPAAVLIHLGEQLSHFTTARLDMIEIYEQMHEMGLNRASTYDQIIKKVDTVVHTYGRKFLHPLLAPLETSFCYETEILKNLIEAQLRILDCNFMGALIRLNNAHRRLTVWPSINQSPEPSLPGSKAAPQKAIPTPALITWFFRYHTALLAKFSLYFYDVLSKQTAQLDLKNLMAKTSPDYYQKIVAFYRKSDALSICIVLDTNGMGYRGLGYRLPEEEPESPTGLESYPAIFCYPSERPTKHWPSVVMTLTMESHRLSQIDAIVAVNDKTMDRTYFLARIEPRLFVAVIFETKKSDKDATVMQFLLEMITGLRCAKTLESLKPV
ncbi:UPF0536 protein C12orf66-like protein [Hypsibius exemplaris]|uniref:UPF0536 protein C12orf66-like protein n=1 Tax=Hypsibius exemplaris TaxID=2072580 RepID=A0A1W0X3T5_HYPEX|nr:UPF0536 protein C12orf66-like protein [Hypsibius exemplaris]